MGHNVQILERSPSALLAEQGAGLGVADDLEAFMREYDAVQEPYMLTTPKAFVVDSQGNLITTLTPGVRATSWNTLYYRLRANFDGLKSDYCGESPAEHLDDGKATYLYGQTVLSVKVEDEKLIVKYHDYDGTLSGIRADLVIAADGAGSRIRQVLEPQVKRRYVGYCAWRGVILEKNMEEETKSLCQESDRHCQIERSFFISSVSQRSFYTSNKLTPSQVYNSRKGRKP
jgi:2-polyprenyl-6-methoxyphenol hydroxylase-like FAD-dependent oxidoreductase